MPRGGYDKLNLWEITMTGEITIAVIKVVLTFSWLLASGILIISVLKLSKLIKLAWGAESDLKLTMLQAIRIKAENNEAIRKLDAVDRGAEQSRQFYKLAQGEMIKKKVKHHPPMPYIGKKFGLWSVISIAKPPKGVRRYGRMVKVKCECGLETWRPFSSLQTGISSGCRSCKPGGIRNQLSKKGNKDGNN